MRRNTLQIGLVCSSPLAIALVLASADGAEAAMASPTEVAPADSNNGAKIESVVLSTLKDSTTDRSRALVQRGINKVTISML